MQYSVSDYILDITSNSIEAGSARVKLSVIENGTEIKVTVEDNGPGMDARTLAKVQDPFYTDGVKHPERKVGLGIPFLVQAVELTGGNFSIESTLGKGTSVDCSFMSTSVDCPPLGDLGGTFRSLMLFDGDYDLIVSRQKFELSYQVSRSELQDTLGELEDGESLVLMKQFFSSNEEALDED